MAQGRTRRLVVSLLVLGVVAGSATRAAAQEPLRLSRNVPGDSKPIILDADEIVTWTDNGQRIVLLKGQVLVKHGLIQTWMQQGVVWVDLNRLQKQHILHVDLYGEGDVRLENGAEQRKGEQALLDLNTRGELKLNAHKSKVVQQALPDDPLFQRAQAEKAKQAPTPDPAKQAGPPPDPAIKRTSATSPTPAPPVTGQPVQGPPSNPPLPDLPPGPPPRAPAVPGPPPPQLVPGVSSRPAGQGPPRRFRIDPRTSAPFQYQIVTQENGEQALVVTGGVILTINDVENFGIVDIEADRLVLWARGNSPQFFNNLRTPEGQASRELEVYLSGNVELRQLDHPPPPQPGSRRPPRPPATRTLRADEVYYDAGRNVAIALSADLEIKEPHLPDPIHFKADELEQLSPSQFKALRAEVFASRLPSDPGLKLYLAQATLDVQRVPRRSIFGQQFISRMTGQPESEVQYIVRGKDIFLKAEDVPIFYLPFIQGNAKDPLGPLEAVNLGYNRIFGGQFGAAFNVYDLLGMDPLPGTRWRLDLDYLTRRGPALGTNFDYAGADLFGVPSRYVGFVKAWGIYDTGPDILGGGRPLNPLDHPDFRGRVLWRQNILDLPYGFSLQSQVHGLSDKNFLEQYYKREFDEDINPETFLYLKQQQDNWAWTLLTEKRIRPWVTETDWLPRADGYWIGQSFFNLFTYNAHASAGYARLQPTLEPPFPVGPQFPTDVRTDTGRFDLWQELALPFYLGPVKVVPYGVLDLTYYTQDLTGDDRGRVLGGGGVRASIPFTRLYPNVESLLFNLNGINHKIVLTGNYYNVASSTSFLQLPQLDRLDDDATDQARRDLTPLQTLFNPRHGLFLATSPLFDIQRYAIRRLVDNRADTLDTIDVFQLDLRQRWQTKRGFPGQQHIVDWMMLDLSASIFPHSNRDNFGETFSFLEYDYVWNIGDRTSLVSTGWFDPIDDGPRVFTIGGFLNRPDRTSLYLGYRQIDPVESKAVTGAVSYIFSPKYAVTASSTYDFGTNQALSNSLVLTRMGKDVQLSLALTYNVLQNNFGVNFQVLPNLVTYNSRYHAGPVFSPALLGR